jgi:NitT/TauT family transport system permease protein
MNSSEGACAVRFSVLHTAGLAPKIIIGFLIAFFPILIDTVIGLRSVETESIFLLQSMGADRWKTFRYVRLPNALPNLFGGMKVAITLAVVGAIVGEFIGANEGLGYVLLFANGILDTQLLFAALVAISLLALVFYAVINLLERIFIRWHVSVRVRDRHHVIRPGDRPRRRHADVRDRHAVFPPRAFAVFHSGDMSYRFFDV